MTDLFINKTKNIVTRLHFTGTVRKGAMLYILILVTILTGCKKLIEVDLPIDKNTKETVYSKASTASLAMIGVYAAMGNPREGTLVGEDGITLITALLADELSPAFTSSGDRIYFNNLDGSTYSIKAIWDNSYEILLFRVNSIIEGVFASESIPDDKKAILLGEAKFARAFIYFNLVNLYGDVPLVLTTDFTMNANIPRTSADKIYEQIIQDLIEAQAALPDNYMGLDIGSTTSERIRPNNAAATALLARVYLYRKNWSQAEAEASKVIALTDIYSLTGLSEVFLKNSNETIWSLQPTVTEEGTNTADARMFVDIFGIEGYSNFILNPSLANSFETNDLRASNWTRITGMDYNIPYKYKAGWSASDQAVSEYTIVLRLAEQYLIRAEARAHQGNITGAENDLRGIRERAGLGETGATTEAEMLDAILHERQVELFAEWGHRWFDIKRSGRMEELMPIIQQAKVAHDGTQGIWASYKALMPIPYDEFKFNPALDGYQNPGYSQQP